MFSALSPVFSVLLRLHGARKACRLVGLLANAAYGNASAESASGAACGLSANMRRGFAIRMYIFASSLVCGGTFCYGL